MALKVLKSEYSLSNENHSEGNKSLNESCKNVISESKEEEIHRAISQQDNPLIQTNFETFRK